MDLGLPVKCFGEGLRRSFAMPNPFVLTNKICLNQPLVQFKHGNEL